VLPTLSGLEDTPRVLTAAELVDGTAPLALSSALDVPDHVEGLPAAGDDSVNDLAASPDAFDDSVNELDGSPDLFDGAEVAASGTLHGAR
jgi:hypothetical protein